MSLVKWRNVYKEWSHTTQCISPNSSDDGLFVWCHSAGERSAPLMCPVPSSDFQGSSGVAGSWPLCSVGRSVYRKGSFRLMTSGGISPQAFMHHVPFTAKRVMGAPPLRISGIFKELAPSTDPHRWKTEGDRSRPGGWGRGGWRSYSLNAQDFMCIPELPAQATS